MGPLNGSAGRRPGAPLRVYHLIKGLGRGGAEMLLVDGPASSPRDRFDYGFGYFVPWKNALVPDLLRTFPVVTCFDAPTGPKMMARLPQVVRAVKAFRADLIHCHMPLASVVGRAVGLLTGIPVISTEHNLIERYHPATRMATLATWRLQRHVVACSGEVQASILRHAGSSVPVTMVANGVSTGRFQRTDLQRRQARERLGIAPDAPVVGTVAVFRTQKRLDLWLEAAARLVTRRPEARFLLVGDGPLKADVDRHVARLGLGQHVILPGLQEDVMPFLAAMDVFFVASDFEGLPVALLEAMSMEVVPVTTDAGGMPEVVDASCGRVVPRGDVGAMVTALESVLDLDPSARAEQAAAARRRVVEQFGTRKMMSELERLYEEVIR